MTLIYSGISVELREIELKNKPESLLKASQKGTVPVLVIHSDSNKTNLVVDESLDIMLWALKQNDPDGWLDDDSAKLASMRQLIAINDTEFKYYLDRYKYADRYPENSAGFYRSQAEVFLSKLDVMLTNQSYLFGDRVSLADIAIFPFIRQFASVDKVWFELGGYARLSNWLERFLASVMFTQTMVKYSRWRLGAEPVFLNV